VLTLHFPYNSRLTVFQSSFLNLWISQFSSVPASSFSRFKPIPSIRAYKITEIWHIILLRSNSVLTRRLAWLRFRFLVEFCPYRCFYHRYLLVPRVQKGTSATRIASVISIHTFTWSEIRNFLQFKILLTPHRFQIRKVLALISVSGVINPYDWSVFYRPVSWSPSHPVSVFLENRLKSPFVPTPNWWWQQADRYFHTKECRSIP